MTSTSAIHDPLGINLRRQTRSLQNILPTPSNHATDLFNFSSTPELLAVLSRLLALPPYTLIIATLYRPILFDLCARWLDEEVNTEEQLVALCLLLEVHEELFPCVFLISPSLFRNVTSNTVFSIDYYQNIPSLMGRLDL